MSSVFFLMSRLPHTSILFPYTTLFRSNLLLLGKIGVFHNRRNASSRLLLLISKHLILCIYLVFRIQQKESTARVASIMEKIGRAVQQECRDRTRMPSSA